MIPRFLCPLVVYLAALAVGMPAGKGVGVMDSHVDALNFKKSPVPLTPPLSLSTEKWTGCNLDKCVEGLCTETWSNTCDVDWADPYPFVCFNICQFNVTRDECRPEHENCGRGPKS